MPVVTDYAALISGSSWNGIELSNLPVIITYSFPAAAPPYLLSIDGFTPSTVSSFEAFTSAEQVQARTALSEWAAASGLIFIEVAPGNGDINFQLVDLDTTSAPSYSGAGGIAFYPFGDWDFFSYPSFFGDLDGSGDVFMNSRFANGGSVTYGTLLHEIGHAIGLKHPTEVVVNYAADPDVVHDQVLSSDDPTRTIMATVGGPPGSDQLQQLDKDAAAFLYGEAGGGGVFTTNASGSNSVLSAWSWNAATQILTETGFAGADTIRGSSVRDSILGLDGDDRLFGLAGNDTLTGGNGNDLLHGGAHADIMRGGSGDDSYFVDDAGDRSIETAGGGYDSVFSRISFSLSSEVELLQLFGANLIGRGNALTNTLYGDGFASNKLYGFGGEDYIVAGGANDTLDGGTGNDTLYGGAGNDSYYVDGLGDQVHEAAGEGIADRVFALASFALGAGEAVEQLHANAGATGLALTGNALANGLYGNAGADTLAGGDGRDVLDGKGGNDRLIGGAGLDTLFGRGGVDVFVLAPLAVDRDTIRDFEHGIDRLEISGPAFGGLGAGTLPASRFLANATGIAGDLDDRFIYNTSNGYFYFDADGTGASARVQISAFAGIPTVTSSDVLIA